MLTKTSPGGSVFPYYYKGGELLGLHFGCFYSDEEGVIALMSAEQDFFIRQNHCLSLWLDFYQTKLTDKVIGELIEFIKKVRPRVTKLGIVGCSLRSKWKLNRLIKEAEGLASLPVKFFRDPEVAKTWLVSEAE